MYVREKKLMSESLLGLFNAVHAIYHLSLFTDVLDRNS